MDNESESSETSDLNTTSNDGDSLMQVGSLKFIQRKKANVTFKFPMKIKDDSCMDYGCNLPPAEFKLEDFAFGKKMDKEKATHHCFKTMTYYGITMVAEQALADRIVTSYLNHHSFYLCEHVDKTKRTRLFLDIDSGDHYSEVLEVLQQLVQSYFKPKELEKLQASINKEELQRWGICCLEWNPCLLVVLRSSPSKDTRKYHFVWPFLVCSHKRSEEFLPLARAAVLAKCKDYDTSKIEMPRTLRAPLCDKWDKNDNRPTSRPYIFHAVVGPKGTHLPPYNDQSPTYPFIGNYDRVVLNEKQFLLSVWALTSLRWTYAFPKPTAARQEAWAIIPPNPSQSQLPATQPLPDEQPDITDVPHHEFNAEAGLSSASEWFRQPAFYNPQTMQQLFDECPEDYFLQHECIVKYINQCAAIAQYNEISILLKQQLPGDAISMNHISKQQASLILGIPKLKLAEKPQIINADKAPKKKKKTHKVSPYMVWTESVDRRIITGSVFSPLKDTPSTVINLWRGFRYTLAECKNYADYSKDGFSLDTFFDHLWNVLCNKDIKAFKFLVGWMAAQIQFPGKNLASTVVVGGPEGCGKTIAFEIFGKLFGEHFLETCNVEDIFGRFNGRIAGKIFILINELDILTRQQDAALKSLITEKTKRLETKFHMPLFIEQACNVAITTNRPDDKIMKVGPNARRYLMLSAKSLPQCDRLYWNNFSSWAYGENGSEGGCKALFYHLSSLDISSFESRDIPPTRMLLEHKMSEMRPEHLFFYECLMHRQISCQLHDHTVHEMWNEQHDLGLEIEEYDLYHSYAHWLKEQTVGNQSVETNFNIFYRHLGRIIPIRRRRHSSYFRGVTSTDRGVIPDNVPLDIDKRRLVCLPTVAVCLEGINNVYTNISVINDSEFDATEAQQQLFEQAPRNLYPIQA